MNKIITWIKNIIGKSVENIAVNLTTYVLISGIAIVIILFNNKLIEFLNYDIQIGIIILIALFVLSLSKIYNYRKSKCIHIFFKDGMEWRVTINKNKVNSIEGPFCSPCKLKMTSMPLYCSICDTEYPALNASNIKKVTENVQNIIEAELRGGKFLLIDWSTGADSYPNSHFNLENHGASTVKDISIKITLEIDGERRDVGIYEFENIEPDKNKRIEQLDPMRKVHGFLKELDLIEIESIEISGGEDEFGHEIPKYLEWLTIRRNFSCNLQLNVNYSLRDKIKNQLNKYIVEFEYVEPYNGYPYRQGEDNCKITMSTIE